MRIQAEYATWKIARVKGISKLAGFGGTVSALRSYSEKWTFEHGSLRVDIQAWYINLVVFRCYDTTGVQSTGIVTAFIVH